MKGSDHGDNRSRYRAILVLRVIKLAELRSKIGGGIGNRAIRLPDHVFPMSQGGLRRAVFHEVLRRFDPFSRSVEFHPQMLRGGCSIVLGAIAKEDDAFGGFYSVDQKVDPGLLMPIPCPKQRRKHGQD